jgi:hypothetical protein
MALPSFEGSSVQSVLWDVLDPHVFLVVDGAAMYQYKYLSMTVTGPRLVLLSKMPLPASHTPVVLRNRVVTCRWAWGLHWCQDTGDTLLPHSDTMLRALLVVLYAGGDLQVGLGP